MMQMSHHDEEEEHEKQQLVENSNPASAESDSDYDSSDRSTTMPSTTTTTTPTPPSLLSSSEFEDDEQHHIVESSEPLAENESSSHPILYINTSIVSESSDDPIMSPSSSPSTPSTPVPTFSRQSPSRLWLLWAASSRERNAINKNRKMIATPESKITNNKRNNNEYNNNNNNANPDSRRMMFDVLGLEEIFLSIVEFLEPIHVIFKARVICKTWMNIVQKWMDVKKSESLVNVWELYESNCPVHIQSAVLKRSNKSPTAPGNASNQQHHATDLTCYIVHPYLWRVAVPSVSNFTNCINYIESITLHNAAVSTYEDVLLHFKKLQALVVDCDAARMMISRSTSPRTQHQLLQVGCATQLKVLELRNIFDMDSFRIIELVRHCRELHTIIFRRILNLDDDFLRCCADAVNWFRLTTLEVSSCPNVTDKGIEYLTSVSGPRLRNLSLAHTAGITSAGIAAIAQNCNTGLAVLDIRGNLHIRDPDLYTLATHCTNLKILDLKGCTSIMDGSFFLPTTCRILDTSMEYGNRAHLFPLEEDCVRFWST